MDYQRTVFFSPNGVSRSQTLHIELEKENFFFSLKQEKWFILDLCTSESKQKLMENKFQSIEIQIQYSHPPSPPPFLFSSEFDSMQS